MKCSVRYQYMMVLFAFLLMCTRMQANGGIRINVYNHTVDSLKNLLKTQELTEEQQFELTHLITINYALYNPDSTISWSRKALPMAQKLNHTEIEIDLCFHTAASWIFRSRYDSVYAYLDRASMLAVELKNKRLEEGAISLRAYAYWQQGMYQTAIDNFLKFLSIAENANDMEDSNNVERAVSTLNNLANINRELGNVETALQYLRRAEVWNESLKESPHKEIVQRYYWYIPEIWNTYAAIYLQQGDLRKAEEFASKADSINIDGIINKNQSKRLLAEIYLQTGNYDKALQEAEKSLEQAQLLGDKALHVNAWQILSEVYLAQKRYTHAEAEALKAWQADSTNVNASRAIAKNLAMANIRMGNDEKAAYYLDKYAELNRQYSEKSFQTTMSDMATKYETEKKELRITDLEREKLLYIVIGFACFMLTVLIWIFLRQKIKNERREKQLIATSAVLEWEKKERKRFASDLHDGINGMLAAIKFELGAVENLQNVRNRLDECIEAIRDMSRSRMPSSLQRYGLKASLEDYCRLFPNVDFHFYGNDRRMDEKLELTVYFCVYELVNNASKHSGAKKINVQLVQNDGLISLTVQDDGCGFDEQNTEESGGLRSIRDRVASLGGKIDIASSPGKGTEINIELQENTD